MARDTLGHPQDRPPTRFVQALTTSPRTRSAILEVHGVKGAWMNGEDEVSDAAQVLPEQRVGAAMREARELSGTSLRQMAKRLGYQSHTALSSYERGAVMPTEKVIEGYEQVLGLQSGELTTVLE